MASDGERKKVYKGLLANPEFVKEFYARVRTIDHPDACWIWQGYVDRFGFGRVRSGRRTFAAHRVAYELANGPVGKDTVIKQECNCRVCVRVEHMVAKNRKRTKQKDVKGSWQPYVDNLSSLTASIFDEDASDLIGGVKVVFGDDPQVAVDKLSPLLRTLGDAVSRCVKTQTDILAAFRDSQAKLAAVPGLAERHVELIRTVERLEQLLSAEVSRETSAPHHAQADHVSRETSSQATENSGEPAYEPEDQDRRNLRETLAALYHQEVGAPCDDAYALYEVYELALAYGGTQAGTYLRSWMRAFAAHVADNHGVPLVSRFLSWAVDAVDRREISVGLGGETPRDPDAPEGSLPGPDASPATPDTPPPSSQPSGPHGAPAALPPSEEGSATP